MNKVKIITDSPSDVPAELEEKYDITVLSVQVAVDDDDYYERADFTNDEFYQMLINAKSIPTTSQIIPMRFLEEYNKAFEAGYSEIVCVTIYSGGSATYNNAVAAKNKFFEKHPDINGSFKIHVVDSKTYTSAYGYPVVEAAIKASKGASGGEITAYLTDWFDSVEIYFAPYTLEFVKKSGRVPVAAAFVGELIGLRPIISIIDGETKIIEKVRGDKAIIPAIMKHASNAMVPKTPYLLVRSLLEAEADELSEKAKKDFGYEAAAEYHVGASISINAGPKVVGLIVKGQNRSHQ